MELQIGDSVSFLNEKLDGVVSKVIDKKSVEVTTTDGFSIPVLIYELVKTGSGNNSSSKSNKVTTRTIDSNEVTIGSTHIPQRSSLEKKEYLCFSKNDSKLTDLFILNNTGYSQFFAVRINKGGEWVLIYSGKVNKQSYVFVSSYNDGELDGFGKVKVDTLNIDFSVKEHQLPKSAEIKIKLVKFYKDSSYSSVPIIEKNAVLIDASGESVEALANNEELLKEVEKITPEVISNQQKLKGLKIIGKVDLNQGKRERNRDEIDLHIEKLNINTKGKSNGEIVQIQLNEAKDFLDKSMLAGKKEIVLIHGVGNGRLKTEIIKMLGGYYGIKSEKADARKFGDGATLVHLKG